MGIDEQGISGNREFPSTVWSVIRKAQDPTAPEYERHLKRLVELYWRPVYCVIRHAWARTDDDAKDLTQEFFATVILDWSLVQSYVPERGSFRGLLRAAITSFMKNTVRDASRKKRGGGIPALSLDGEASALVAAIPDPGALTPEQLFDVAWNRVVMTRAVELLERKLTSEGKAAAFEAFRRYDLEGLAQAPQEEGAARSPVKEDVQKSYAALGEALGMSVPQVKHALLHARAAFRDVVGDIVRGYVDGPEELAAELRNLFSS
jgi:RNA polymerase sigma-70 factor (ECF subfamily)